MDLLTIENLCIAAEATVVLLLLAFAWRPVKKSEQEQDANDFGSVSWEPAKAHYLRSILLRGLYLQQWNDSQATHTNAKAIHSSQPFAFVDGEEPDTNTEIPEPWQDRLTKLSNRTGFDSILRAWLAIDPVHRGPSCISMLTLSSYSELASTKGAMVTECALRAVSKRLSETLSCSVFASRYQPDRFVLLHFTETLATCHATMTKVQKAISADGFFENAGVAIATPCIVSLLDLSGDTDITEKLEKLEEGFLQAEENGQHVVTLEEKTWTDQPPASTAKETHRQAQFLDDSSSVIKSTSAGPAEPTSVVHNHQSESQSESADQASDHYDEASSGDAPASNDISAVASPDDIAALFAQIHGNQSDSPAPPTSGPANAPEGSPAAASAPAENADNADTASADDIAALFAAAKQTSAPNKPPAAPAKPATAPPTSPPAVEPAPASAENQNDSVSADDIAALFASVKPNAKPAQASAPQAQTAPTTPAAAAPVAPSNAPPEDLSESASADDIAALFASVKTNAKPAQASTTPVQAAPTPAAAAPAAPPSPTSNASPVDLSESASADDIAALFASVKPAAKPQPAATPSAVPPAAATPPIASVSAPTPAVPIAQTPNANVDLTESASADDIAALFASVKPASSAPPKNTPPQPAPPQPAATQPAATQPAATQPAATQPAATQPAATQPAATQTAKPTASTSSAPSPAVDLSESASADDIAALFASVKPSAATAPTKPATATPEPPKTVTATADPAPSNAVTKPPSSAPVNVSETASADDIAALFASVKPASPAPAPKSSETTSNAEGKQTPSKTVPAPTAAQNASTTKPTAPVPAVPAPARAPVAPAPVAATPVPAAAVDPNETATADDIAALFATIQPKSPAASTPPKPQSTSTPTPVPAPTPASAPSAGPSTPSNSSAKTPATQPAQIDLSESATADDIAALFATVKSGVTPPPANATSNSTPAPAPPPAAQIPKGEELNEHATADDIEALFAAMKK